MIRISARLAAVLVGTLLVVAGFSHQGSLAQAPAGGAVALTGARVIDGTGAAPIEQATIVINNGRIESVGPAASAKIPAGATRVDMSGKTITPGLINAHGHLSADPSNKPTTEKLAGQLRVYADYGVTTVYVLGAGVDDLDEAVMLRESQANGPLSRARVFVAGSSIRNLKTEQEARAAVDRYADQKADIIKIHITGGPMDMTPAVYGALIDQAHKRGLRVAAHLFYLKDAKGLLEKQVDVFAHSVRDQPVDAALIAEMKRRNIGYIPTLTRDLAQFVYESSVPYFTDPFFLRHIAEYRNEMNQLKDPALMEKTRNNKAAQDIKPALQMANRNLKTLQDAGVTIAMGTDTGTNLGQWQGYFEQIELEMMVKAGLTPMQTIVAATGGAAKVMKLDQNLGTIAPGKQADLLVLNANPLTDIKNTRQIHSVWIGGRRLPDVPSLNTAQR
jgi:imidazolonepropionase-like amidohydrolase